MRTSLSSSRRQLLSVAAVVALVGCSSSSSPSPFNGSWSCTTTSVYTFTSPAKQAPTTKTTTTSIVIDVNSGDTVTLEEGSVDGGKLGDAGAGCSLSYSTSGSSPSLVPGQTCPVVITSNSLTVDLTVDFTTGSGTVDGSKMTFSGADTFTGSAKSGAVSVALAGTVAGSTTCTK